MLTLSERKARAMLPIARFVQSHMPLWLSHWIIRQSTARVRLDATVSREAVSADSVPCDWIIPQDSQPGRAMLYLHGGGFVFDLSPRHLKMAAHVAQKMGLRTLVVDYRLAPDHPFPAALVDCVTAYRWLMKQGFQAQNIVFLGDSAGGNLAIATLMSLHDEGVPLPAAAACLSPVTNLAKKRVANPEFEDPLLPPKALKFYQESYVGHNDAHTPLISPVFGDLRGLPPLLVHAGEDEILREDAIRIASVAKAAGVDVRLEIYPRMWHVWQLHLTLPQTVQSLEDIAQFLGSHLDQANPDPAQELTPAPDRAMT